MSRRDYLWAAAGFWVCGISTGLALVNLRPIAAAGWLAWTAVVLLLNLPRRKS
jgi:hypothetical protein